MGENLEEDKDRMSREHEEMLKQGDLLKSKLTRCEEEGDVYYYE